MPLKTNELESKLVHKFGFDQAHTRSSDHRWYEINVPGCPPILTKVSHGAKELSPSLESMIARQLRVRKTFLREMINCTKSLDDYQHQVQTAPIPPFDKRF
jgi:hypothetical protein